VGDHDIEGTSTEWGIKITPPGKMPAPYYRAFASKQAAQAEDRPYRRPAMRTCHAERHPPEPGTTRRETLRT